MGHAALQQRAGLIGEGVHPRRRRDQLRLGGDRRASGFLAVYLAGVVLASAPPPVDGLLSFYEGLASTAQAVLFLLLGLLVFPSELVGDFGAAALVTALLVLVARPAAVHGILTPLGIPQRESVLVSWAGLRGAVPVVLATIPLTAGHPDGSLVFDVAFVVVVISVALQAPLVTPLARRLGLGADDGAQPVP
jgi:cell volume regulation protein A